jgi:hypothetical protein
VRVGPEIDSAVLGSLEGGTTVLVHEKVTLPSGQARLMCSTGSLARSTPLARSHSTGWTSAIARDGSVLLVELRESTRASEGNGTIRDSLLRVSTE